MNSSAKRKGLKLKGEEVHKKVKIKTSQPLTVFNVSKEEEELKSFYFVAESNDAVNAKPFATFSKDSISNENSPIHYQNIQYDEVRDHGVEYHMFSADEEKEQVDMLNPLRQRIGKKKAAFKSMKRKKASEARLAITCDLRNSDNFITISDENEISAKRLRLDVNNEDSEFPSNLRDESRLCPSDEIHGACQTNEYRNNFHHLIELMYRLDLSVLCSLRKFTFERKYPSLSLAFGDYEIDKFSNIVLRYEDKSIHIQIENVDDYYMVNGINYARLFTKENQTFSINGYFDSFVKHLISKSDSLSSNIEYLIVYTNSGLDLTEEKNLKKGRFKILNPFKLVCINMEECGILKDFLFTNDNLKGRGFYQFLRDKATREELLMRLEFSFAVQKVIRERKLSQKFQKEIKYIFLDKLIFAIKQPNRGELNNIVKNEIEKNRKVQYDYIVLRKEILHDITVPGKQKYLGKVVNYIPGIIYEFTLLMLFLHDMFLHKNIFSITSERKSDAISNDITVSYKDKIMCIKAYNTNSNIGYSQLFPSGQQEEKTMFSINKHFALFIEGMKEDTEYIIIYTNADLDITEEKKLKKCDLIKFDNIGTKNKRGDEILTGCSYMNKNGLYQFSQEKTIRKNILHLLTLPSSSQTEKEGRVFKKNESEMKETFLDKLVFAVNQPNEEELNNVIRSEIAKSNKVLYNYEELHEIALRWSESRELGPITERNMKKLCEDIKSNRSTYDKIQSTSKNEETKFAKSVVGREGSPAFFQFLDFITKGEGIKYLEVLKRKGINLPSVSSILSGARAKASVAFKELYNLWFDKQGNETLYLKTLEENRIKLANMSSILSGTGAGAAKAFKDLFDLWFDTEGNKTQYLKTLEDNGINLPNMSSILSGAGAKAFQTFKGLYDLLFDKQGNKSQYLKTLEENRINLTNMSSILNKVGAKAPQAFKELHNLWFDGEGIETRYLITLEENGINVANISSILHGAGAGAAKAFKDLFDLWFDTEGNKTQYLETLAENGINLPNMSSILNGAGAKAPQAFTELYDLWFDKRGNKTQYLKTLEENEVSLTNMSSILNKVGVGAAKAFKDLYNLWFDEQGNQTQYLNILEKEGINLPNMSSILSGAGVRAPQAFKGLYNLWFDKEGNKMPYLKTLEENEISLTNMSGILSGAGAGSEKAFKDLYDLWFDVRRNKTQYLRTLGESGINLANISSILHRAGVKASQAFKSLYNLWFDKQGNKTQYLKTLEENRISLTNASGILSGAGVSAAKAFKELYDLWFDEQGNKQQYLKHFIEKKDGRKGFAIHNLTGILSGAGANVKAAFEKLHSVCFNGKGKRTELLDDFYTAGFKPSNLSCLLCGAGVRASFILKNLHGVCFNEQREKTELLNDFYKAGFRPRDLCGMLSAAPDNLEKFHDFCFIGKTKMYLNHFLNEKESFTLTNLSKILHGARSNICSALRDFHDICFDESGSRTQLLDDFYTAGFTPSDLSDILSMAGNNATFIFRNFHKVCFKRKNYLNHFLAEKELFTPKGLSKILCGLGTKVGPTFKKLHHLCFDKGGNRSNYLNKLIKKNSHNVVNILYEKVR